MKKIFLLLVFVFVANSAHAVDIGNIIGSAVTGVQKVAEASKEITPAEEHYIGRTVAAMVIHKYPVIENPALTKYLNKVGLLVAYMSDSPETYGGYHFAAVENSDVNAYACPGGFIFVTRGLLNQVASEDQLAVILGHEIAHVAHRDGINSIKKSRWTDFGFYAAGEAAGHFSPGEVKDLTNAFTSVITDVGKKVIESGYSQSEEKKADESGLHYASAAGYDPNGLIALLEEEIKISGGGGGGPFASHPKSETRISLAKSEIEKENLSHPVNPARTARYKQAVK